MPYSVENTGLKDVLLLKPKLFADARGFFFESFNQREFEKATGLNIPFVQDNHSLSQQGVLRGLHFQKQFPQGKLIRVVRGEIFDVAVDIRPESPQYGHWSAAVLTGENHHQLWIAPGFCAWLFGAERTGRGDLQNHGLLGRQRRGGDYLERPGYWD